MPGPTKHDLPLGTPVEFWREGVYQRDAVVFRHDRNGTYRLEEVVNGKLNQTYVTAYRDELRPVRSR